MSSFHIYAYERNSLLIIGHSHFSGITPSSSFEADMTIPHGQKLKVSCYSLRSNKFCSHKFHMWHLKCWYRLKVGLIVANKLSGHMAGSDATVNKEWYCKNNKVAWSIFDAASKLLEPVFEWPWRQIVTVCTHPFHPVFKPLLSLLNVFWKDCGQVTIHAWKQNHLYITITLAGRHTFTILCIPICTINHETTLGRQ